MPDADDHFGPIDTFVVAFGSGAPSARGFDRLLELVDAGHIRVIDVEFVTNSSGEITRVDASTLGDAVAGFVGASSGLLDEADLDLLAGELDEGVLAAVVVYEELAILDVFDRFEADGAEVVLEGHLSPIELADALDSTDAV